MVEIAKIVGLSVLIALGVVVFIARAAQSLKEVLTPEFDEPSAENVKIISFLNRVEKSCLKLLFGVIKSLPHIVVTVSSCIVLWVIYSLLIT